MPGVLTGIAWYQRPEWPLLLAFSTDAAGLERTYDQWRAVAEDTYARMQREGSEVERIEVRVAELVVWCAEKGRPLDESARAEFVANKLRQREPVAT